MWRAPSKWRFYGISYADLITTLRNALNENTLFTITTGDESLPVVIGNNLRDLDDLLGKTFIRSAETEIPVGILMRQTMDTDLKQIVAGAEGDYYPLDLTPSTKDIPRCHGDDQALRSRRRSFRK